MKGKKNSLFQTGKLERTSYWLYFAGLNIFYGLIYVNIQTFYSDVGISAAAIAVIMLITKVWDAINDPLFGGIVDRVHFKKGRFIPWLRISVPLLCISGILFFAIPKDLSNAPKIIWAVLAYLIFDIAYTMSDVPMFILPMTMTNNVNERGTLLTIGRYFAMVSIMGISVVIPIVQKRFGWFACGAIITLIATAFNVMILLFGKERHVEQTQDAPAVSGMFKAVLSNKYLLIFTVSMCIQGVTNFAQFVSLYFARYNLGNQDLAGLLTLLSFVPTLLVGLVVPLITKKMDKFVLYFSCQVITSIMGIVRYFIGYSNFMLFIVLTFVSAIFSSVTYIIMYTFILDVIEYGTYHTGQRNEGMVAALQTFISKFTSSIAGSIAMMFLAVLGFASGEVETQSAAVMNGFWMLQTILPAAGTLLSVFLLCFYKLRDKDVQVMTQYNNGLITRKEAEEKLAEKYGPAAG